MTDKPKTPDQPAEVEQEGTMIERIQRDAKKMKAAPENKKTAPPEKAD